MVIPVRGAVVSVKGDPVMAVPLPTRKSPDWKVPDVRLTVTVVPLMAVMVPIALETEPLTLWPRAKPSVAAAEMVMVWARGVATATRRIARA
jgi:hypothetical protein